jgi:hypothetical protein
MPEIHDPLILDLVAWVAVEPRPYAEVMDAWRTSCPRLPVWEDAVDRGLVARRPGPGGALVAATPAGLALLSASGRRVNRPAPPGC